MATRKQSDDKLKSLLSRDTFSRSSIEEVNVSEYISPVANIKVI